MKKILITGNSGYIGSHLSKMLLQRNLYEIHGLDKSVSQIPLVKQYYQNINDTNDWNIFEYYDYVIHLAAEVSVSHSVRDPILYYKTNTIGTLNVLKNIKAGCFIHASTGAASQLNSPYGISKRGAEDIVRQFCNENQINYTIFRFYNVTGSDGINPTNPDGLMWNLINAQKIGSFNLFGDDYNTEDGSAIRDYVHVNEICASLMQAFDNPTNQIENLGHGVGISVKQMIQLFKLVNNCEFEIKVCPRRAGDIEKSVLDNPSKFMQKLYTYNELLKL
jgi:UDP-glucose 4-epimerase